MLKLNRKAQSVLEYMAILVFITGAFLVFQLYIMRAFSGRWKGVGDQFASGKLYDPKLTTECAYDFRFFNKWYNVEEYESRKCAEICLKQIGYSESDCRNCIAFAISDKCR